jgi:arabinogalactan oligomer / maltooligosaccharide transport system permease protein
MKSLKAGRIISNVIIYTILIVLSCIWLLPLIWLVLQSFGGEGIGGRARLIPTKWTLNNYVYLFSNITGQTNPLASTHQYDGLFLQWFGNTIIVAVFSCIISTLFVLGTAYALSRFRFKSRTIFMKMNLVIGMFPGFLSMIIMYWVMKEIFHLQGTYWSLIILYSAGAGGGYYICKGFFDTISKNIDEAAMIDGATRSQIFWQIILPLAKPIIVYTVLTSFMSPWGDYVTSSYIIGLQNQDSWTVAIGLYQFTSGNDTATTYYTQFAAGSVIIAIPITVLFLCLQKYYVEGVTGGAVKG